jgi:rubredoxin
MIQSTKGHNMKTWQCIVCFYIYDEAQGDPEHGIAPGTRWEDVPENWECPHCGVSKADFEMVEVAS